MELASLVDPKHTTILCMEMQRGVVGDLARFSGPGDAVAELGIIDRCAALFEGAPDRAKSLVNSGALPPSYLAGYSETLLLSPTRSPLSMCSFHAPPSRQEKRRGGKQSGSAHPD